jgi:HSF-type DNA-binding
VICWLPHGRSWRILKHRDFENVIMPQYFGHCKLSSFLRQAASWGFRRIATGISIDSYVHPLFLRGLPHLCKLMKRHATDKERGCRLALDDLDLDRFPR